MDGLFIIKVIKFCDSRKKSQYYLMRSKSFVTIINSNNNNNKQFIFSRIISVNEHMTGMTNGQTVHFASVCFDCDR